MREERNEREIFGNREIPTLDKREIAGINYCGIKEYVNKCQGIIYINIILSIKGVKQFV